MEDGHKELVGHLSIELSMLFGNFLKAADTNRIIAEVVGSRKREAGLVVPAKYTALTKELKIAQ